MQYITKYPKTVSLIDGVKEKIYVDKKSGVEELHVIVKENVEKIQDEILFDLSKGLELVKNEVSFSGLFIQSFSIIIREGFETILIIAALISFLRKSKNDAHVKNIHISEIKKKLKSVSLNASKLKKYDCVVILTNHSKINYEQILKYSKIIFDTRGCLPKNSKVINL